MTLQECLAVIDREYFMHLVQCAGILKKGGKLKDTFENKNKVIQVLGRDQCYLHKTNNLF